MKTVKILATVFIILVFISSAIAGGVINLPKTGQTTIYAAGDDGDLQKGITWPSPRFTWTVCGAIDNLTGLMWQDHSGFYLTSDGARDYVSSINSRNNGPCDYHDWHLPTVNEFESLMNLGEADQTVWLKTQGFDGITSSYWASLGYSEFPAWEAVMTYGTIRQSTNKNHIMLVRKAIDGPARVWETRFGNNESLDSGVDWPSQRFTDNGNGTVTDNLTGLIWLKDANCIQSKYSSFDKEGYADGKVSWQRALDFIVGINNGMYPNCGAGLTDWRLPNRKELWSLTGSNLSYTFTNASFNVSHNYWTSSTNARFTDGSVAWVINMGTGEIKYYVKSNYYDAGYVWPVRGGIDSGTFALTVVKAGAGSGTVISNSSDIDCGLNCSGIYSSGTVVTLTATPDIGSAFAGWGNACSSCGTNLNCQVVVDSDKTCTATFTLTLMPVPAGQFEYTYGPSVNPVVDSNPSQAKPIGVGTVATGGNTLSLRVSLPEFISPVDVYLAIYAPVIDPNIWMIKPDLTLQPVSMGLIKWRENTIGPINEALYGDISISGLPHGTYNLYIAVTPSGNLENFYLWSTYFIVP